jgi:hypothetical protein
MFPVRMFRFVRNYRRTGRRVWENLHFFNRQRALPRYQAALTRYSEAMLIERRIDVAATPYYNQELMAHVRRHLPNWRGFQTEHRSYVYAEWSPIFQEWDWSTAKLVLNQEQPLLQRDRLMQIFAACPEGSYGYYAQFGLAPFKAVVGSFAAATIDELFASQVHILKQPFSPEINDIMSTIETRYWNSREDLLEHIAGLFLIKSGRERGVRWPAKLMTIWEGQRKPKLPEGEALEAEQLAEAQSVLTEENLKKMDDAAMVKFSSDLYDRLVAEGKAKKDRTKVGSGSTWREEEM